MLLTGSASLRACPAGPPADLWLGWTPSSRQTSTVASPALIFPLQIISLGVHVIDEDFTQPILLMEAMPSLLAKRDFDPPLTLRMVEPGFRDSPDPEHNMAIAFVKVSKGLPCGRKQHRHALRQQQQTTT